MNVALIVVAVIVALAVLVVVKSFALVPQAEAAVVERLGRYNKTISGELAFLIPFVDRVRAKVDLRERVVSFPPQPVITQDNLTVSIDTVVYFQVTNPQAAVYEINNYIVGVEQLTTTTLRNVVGGMTLEETLTSRDSINGQLRGVLDEATGRWGIRVNRVELKGIDPPPSIKDSMEKQMRADRDKRAAILTAEGMRQSQILTAEGQKQSAILTAEGDREALILRAQGDRQSRILRAQGEGQAILTVFQSIHDGSPDQALLAYQYLQMLPKIAEGDANKVWIVPSEIGRALEGLGSTIGSIQGIPTDTSGPRNRVDYGEPVDAAMPVTGSSGETSLSSAHEDVAEAIKSAEAAASPSVMPTRAPAAPSWGSEEAGQHEVPPPDRPASGQPTDEPPPTSPGPPQQ